MATTSPVIATLARQRGVTLTELMIALVLGALVVLAATAMVVSSRGTYRTQDETTRLAESARFGLELGNRLVRLVGYTNWGDGDTSPPPSYVIDTAWALSPDAFAFNGPNIVGANNLKPDGTAGLNGSDALTIRFFGSSLPNTTAADGNVLDCAGNPVPEPLTPPVGVDATSINRTSRAYNVLFVDADSDGEPALKCVTQSYNLTTGVASGVPSQAQTLIRGVEDFQVLYGELIPQASPNSDLDSNVPQSIVYRTGIGGSNPVQHWEYVKSIRIAMLLRSATGTRVDVEPVTAVYNLFGAGYTATDPGATFSLSTLSASERTRVRRVVETTIFVRNRVNDWPSAGYN
jgi:type IV pilus assembly protein PilW